MKKLLATGLMASVAMASTEASACGNGGFYVGLNAGVALTKAKTSHEAKTDYKAGDTFGGTDSEWKVAAVANAVKLITADHANKWSAVEEKILEDSKSSKKKAKPAFQAVLGYDSRLNDVMMGVELLVGGVFGSNKFTSKEYAVSAADRSTATGYNNNTNAPFPVSAKDYAKVKEQWHIALMPRIGYLFMPQFEGYVTFGLKLAKFKTSVLNRLNDDVPELAAQANVKIPEKTYNKKSTKAVFLLGAGARYEISPELFAKLEYNFEFGAKPKLHKDAMPELKKIKVTSHTIKLGLGYRF